MWLYNSNEENDEKAINADMVLYFHKTLNYDYRDEKLFSIDFIFKNKEHIAWNFKTQEERDIVFKSLHEKLNITSVR
jgi:hypothetical protein